MLLLLSEQFSQSVNQSVGVFTFHMVDKTVLLIVNQLLPVVESSCSRWYVGMLQFCNDILWLFVLLHRGLWILHDRPCQFLFWHSVFVTSFHLV